MLRLDKPLKGLEQALYIGKFRKVRRTFQKMMLRKMESTKDKLGKERKITAKGCNAATALAGNFERGSV